ncbi:MAG: (2Fe-2S)-binding protein [Acidobacteriota bacterium]|nr:(2Fe-2S)-binding protein [Acidobacteriota bacterium]
MKTTFEQFLDKHDEQAWEKVLNDLLPEIHEVDRAATQIWFKFFPLSLFRALSTAEDKQELIRKFLLQGKFELSEQIDSSHHFLYGHRFWRETKDAIVARAQSANGSISDLATEIRNIAKSVADKIAVDKSLLVGITAVGLMTLVQVGLEKLKAAPGTISIDSQNAKKSAKSVLAERAKDDSQGFLGFLKTVDKQWTVVWDENQNNAKFRAINEEEIASAAQRDQSQNWLEKDPRCIEGVIPVECRSAACGTCWVGVLGGAEKLSAVERKEAKSMRRFGYLFSDEPKPIIRLACQAQTTGAVSIVIPPWNGVFGKQLYKENVPEEILEPATTTAKQTRTIVQDDSKKNQLL